MKNHPRLVAELFNRPLAITRAKHAAICRVVEAHLANAGIAPLRLDDSADDDGDSDSHDPLAERMYRQVGDSAIIAVHGILGKHLDLFDMISGGCDVTHVCGALDIAIEDRNVRQIILDFRSPGGAVTGIPEAARKIASITSKKTIAFTDSECCSGAIWLASQCQNFYCTESSTVGSIGVWCAYWDLTRQMEQDGKRIQSFQAGRYKLMGASWKPLDEEEQAILQADVEKLHEQFKDAVCLRREIADENMQGQTFDGPESLEAGLVDGLVDDLEDLL